MRAVAVARINETTSGSRSVSYAYTFVLASGGEEGDNLLFEIPKRLSVGLPTLESLGLNACDAPSARMLNVGVVAGDWFSSV